MGYAKTSRRIEDEIIDRLADYPVAANRVQDGAGRVMMTADERRRVAAMPGGPLLPGAWVRLPAIYRLDLSGAGTVTIDVRTMGGAVRVGQARYNVTAPASQHPYFGDDAREVRVTLTGTAQAEII